MALLPLLAAALLLVWTYLTLIHSGYPLIATAAWSVPVAASFVVGNYVLDRPWNVVVPMVGLIVWVGMYLSSRVRWFWYVRVFGWRA